MTDTPTTIRLYGTVADSIVDGPGLRYSVFVQGCPHVCPGCHNPESQAFEGGYEASIDELVAEITANKLIGGVTLSGGEPLTQSTACLELAKQLKQKDLNLWLYSGYCFEDILAEKPNLLAKELVLLCDVLVDGPFVEALHSYSLSWKGSSNQRVIDIPQSIKAKKIILWEKHEDFPKPPLSW